MEPARYPEDDGDEPQQPPMTRAAKLVLGAVLGLVAVVVALHLSGVIGGSRIGH